MPTTLRAKRPTSLVIPSNPDDFEDNSNDNEQVLSVDTDTKTKPVKKLPTKKVKPKVVTGTGEAVIAAETPKKKRGAPPGRRSATDEPESRPPGHKGVVAIFYMVGDKHKWKIFSRNGRCWAVSGADFTTFAPAVESVRGITGTKNEVVKDENGYQAIDIDLVD